MAPHAGARESPEAVGESLVVSLLGSGHELAGYRAQGDLLGEETARQEGAIALAHRSGTRGHHLLLGDHRSEGFDPRPIEQHDGLGEARHSRGVVCHSGLYFRLHSLRQMLGNGEGPSWICCRRDTGAREREDC